MSSISFEHLISKYPSEKDVINRIERFIASNQSAAGKPSFSVKRIYDNVCPHSEVSLAKILNGLVEEGVLRKIVRVESPVSGGGIQDFDSLIDVPEVLYDWTQDVNITVHPDNIRILFEIVQK
jgi:hypothetical protein